MGIRRQGICRGCTIRAQSQCYRARYMRPPPLENKSSNLCPQEAAEMNDPFCFGRTKGVLQEQDALSCELCIPVLWSSCFSRRIFFLFWIGVSPCSRLAGRLVSTKSHSIFALTTGQQKRVSKLWFGEFRVDGLFFVQVRQVGVQAMLCPAPSWGLF